MQIMSRIYKSTTAGGLSNRGILTVLINTSTVSIQIYQ
jgi:hypothetical protein